jgi:uncharacterized protein YlaI
MAEYLFPFLACQNCRARIALPRSTPEGIPISQTGWPSDNWTRMFLCLECENVYAYSGQDVHWEPFPKPFQSPQAVAAHVVCSEIRCAIQNCPAILRIHAAGDISAASRKLADAISAQRFHVSCSGGHPATVQESLHVQPCVVDSEWWIG